MSRRQTLTSTSRCARRQRGRERRRRTRTTRRDRASAARRGRGGRRRTRARRSTLALLVPPPGADQVVEGEEVEAGEALLVTTDRRRDGVVETRGSVGRLA